MKRVWEIDGRGKAKVGEAGKLAEVLGGEEIETRVEAIQALIPVALLAVKEALQGEVQRWAGPRHSRGQGKPGHVRWGRQRGSVYLGDQKVAVCVPRVRDLRGKREVPLTTYRRLRQPRALDEGLFRRVLLGLSCRRYEECAEAVPGAFGLSASSVSRRFIRSSAKRLRALLERPLEGYDFVALVLDGKTFGEDEMVIALGVTMEGKKVLLGFVQTATENASVLTAFLQELVERGLRFQEGLLCVIDGSKGLGAAIGRVFGQKAQVQRCQWHKRENVLRYLPKQQWALWRRKLQDAYQKPTYPEAKRALDRVRKELYLLNASAVTSLEEGLEETLTLHRLGLFQALGECLKTTNSLESVMAQVQRATHRIGHWRNSEQKQRWLAAALWDVEPRFRRIKGYRHLPFLRAALQREIATQERRGAA